MAYESFPATRPCGAAWAANAPRVHPVLTPLPRCITSVSVGNDRQSRHQLVNAQRIEGLMASEIDCLGATAHNPKLASWSP